MIPEELAWTDTEACDDADHAADADVAHEGQVKLQQEREERDTIMCTFSYYLS